jgi:predicted nucleic acid-binding protein
LIVTSAQEVECECVLTEDLQHGQVFGGLRVENPFLAVVG